MRPGIAGFLLSHAISLRTTRCRLTHGISDGVLPVPRLAAFPLQPHTNQWRVGYEKEITYRSAVTGTQVT